VIFAENSLVAVSDMVEPRSVDALAREGPNRSAL